MVGEPGLASEGKHGLSCRTSRHWIRSGAGSLAALGIVYGDIGTSPLYALRVSLDGAGHELAVSTANVLGVLSLVFWSLVVIVSIKYLGFVMRADNHGEGGILALTALVSPQRNPSRTPRRGLILIGLVGTALLYGDGMITPAISVLAAVEGTSVATSALESWVTPLAVAILIGLFAIQRRGTAAIGAIFGPVMLVWFTSLAVLGTVQLIGEPSVLRAVDPSHAVRFFAHNRLEGLYALGGVFLVVTGAEALYADMGHFGRRPIQRAWFRLVLPSLLLVYFGQGALLLAHPQHIDTPFYRMAPPWGILPLTVLATAATVIASQALISGAFSLTVQAIQLGYLPRLRVLHTSQQTIGQIYVPAVNWTLMVASIGLVVGFGSSRGLAGAYGVAVVITMVITTTLLLGVLPQTFGWHPTAAWLLGGAFLAVDAGFLGANLLKIPSGGWFPLIIGAGTFTLLTTWRTGRRIVRERILPGQVPLAQFVAARVAGSDEPVRVSGTAVYLTSLVGMTPPALDANLRHNAVLHQRSLVVSVTTDTRPHVPPSDRADVVDFGHGIYRIVLHYGFAEEVNVPRGLTEGAAKRLALDPGKATFFLGSESLVVTGRPGMARWREHLFALLTRNATSVANYFGLPPDRTITIGSQVEL
jgi:KUP system potassium uptake protein